MSNPHLCQTKEMARAIRKNTYHHLHHKPWMQLAEVVRQVPIGNQRPISFGSRVSNDTQTLTKVQNECGVLLYTILISSCAGFTTSRGALVPTKSPGCKEKVGRMHINVFLGFVGGHLVCVPEQVIGEHALRLPTWASPNATRNQNSLWPHGPHATRQARTLSDLLVGGQQSTVHGSLAPCQPSPFRSRASQMLDPSVGLSLCLRFSVLGLLFVAP